MDDNNNTTSPAPTNYPAPPPAGKKNLLPIIVVLIVAALLGGFLILRQSKKSQPPQVSAIPSNEPTPTEKPKINKATVKIQALNGTGTPGQANSVVSALTKAGYSADNIKTGNATEYNHTTTDISAKSGFEDIASDIKTALGSLFNNISLNSSPLGSDNQYDIVVTTGGKIYQTPTPATTATPSATTIPTPSGPSSTPSASVAP